MPIGLTDVAEEGCSWGDAGVGGMAWQSGSVLPIGIGGSCASRDC